MSTKLGASFHSPNARDAVAMIRYAESVGVQNAWLTTGAGPDALTVFGAAAATTGHIRLGTSIVPTFPRNPVVVAQQAADIESIAPGRFTLGLGPSHAPVIEGRYGVAYQHPLQHLREFIGIVKALLAGEEVRSTGRHYCLQAKLGCAAKVPVIISALRRASFELAGECADGAVSWLCPARYLRDVAAPAVERGALHAARARPKLIGHAFIALTHDVSALRAAAESSLAHYPRMTNYQEMFAAAGFPEAREGRFSAAMLAATVLHGDEENCADKITEFLQVSGCDQMILSVLPVAADRVAATERTLRFIGAAKACATSG
jgi:F420-dependent oxidoreductase-like protein